MTSSRLFRSWRHVLHLAKEQLTLLGAAEQTRQSWARPVQRIDEIPAAYRSYLEAHLPGLEACLPAVLTPTFISFLRQENEKLVFAHSGRLYILERTPTGLLPVVFPFSEVNLIEVGVILLKAWLQVRGLVAGQLRSSTLRYNSVTSYLFEPLVSETRSALSEAGSGRRETPAVDMDQEKARFDPLRAQYFKFMNYARKSLLPGARVITYSLQPEIRRPRFTVLGHPLLPHTLDTTHLCILTEDELIVIRDDPSSMRSSDHTRYGGVWDYLPLRRVLTAELQARDDALVLALRLPGDDCFEVLFSADRRTEAEQLCVQVKARVALAGYL
jgi:hypothetical protein